MTGPAPWGNWRPQFRSSEEVECIRAWYRRVACPGCGAGTGRACRTASGHPTDHHRARRDAAGPPPYEKWRKEGLFQQPGPPVVPAILEESRAASGEFGIDEPLGDSVAIVSHVFANQLGLVLADEPTLDRFDDAARTLALARGPIGSADLITVLASQVVTLAAMVSGPGADPEAVFTALIRNQVALSRQRQKERKNLEERETPESG